MNTRQDPARPSREVIAEATHYFIELRSEEGTRAQRDHFERWLRASPQHIQAYLEIAAAWNRIPGRDPGAIIDLDQLIRQAKAAPDNVVVDLRADVPSIAAGRRSSGRRFALAAGILLLIAGGILTYARYRSGLYETQIGEQRAITLTDGSTVELNSDSRVRVRYSERERHIELLAGQALFQVAKQKRKPFIVRSGATQVRAVGTQFDVYRKHSGTTVTVLEGVVAVEQPSVQDVVLTAGEQALVTAQATVKSAAPDIAAATAWTQKRLVFEETPLADVVEEFNRYNLRRLVIDDAALRTLAISGLYSSRDPATLIAFLKTDPKIRIVETDREIRISKTP